MMMMMMMMMIIIVIIFDGWNRKNAENMTLYLR
jgi:hypothetical protein